MPCSPCEDTQLGAVAKVNINIGLLIAAGVLLLQRIQSLAEAYKLDINSP